MKISIIHPSRSRPELAKKVYDEWMGNAANPENIGYTLSIDNEDPTCKEYKALFDPVKCLIVQFSNKSAIEAINRGAKFTRNDLLIVVSDDFSCPKNWDVDLLSQVQDKKDFCVKTQDGIQPWMMTLPIMDREYYNRFGYIYHPAYLHMYADLELACVADLLGKKIDVPILFPHKHYSQAGGIKKDVVSQKNDSTYEQGEKVFLERISRNFDLKDSEIIGRITPDRNCRAWFAKHRISI